MPSPERHEAHVDDVAGLLAAERPAALAQLLEHVAVADLRRGDLDAGRRASPRGSRSSSSPSPRRRRPAAGRAARRCRAASAISSSPSTTTPSRSTARTRSPSPSKAKPSVVAAGDDGGGERVDVRGAAAVVDVAPVGRVADDRDVGAQAPEDLGRDAVGRAVGAVQQDVEAVEVERREARVRARAGSPRACRAARGRGRCAAEGAGASSSRRSICASVASESLKPSAPKNLMPLSR